MPSVLLMNFSFVSHTTDLEYLRAVRFGFDGGFGLRLEPWFADGRGAPDAVRQPRGSRANRRVVAIGPIHDRFPSNVDSDGDLSTMQTGAVKVVSYDA
jgi:hypothetical protein